MSQASVTFPSGDIELEGIWHIPPTNTPPPAVVVCHPHPLYGGTMSNNIIVALCDALAHQSIASLRFNFRGVGRSGGQFSKGNGEQEDVRAALAFVSARDDIDADRIGLAGYSFGGSVALPVAHHEERVKLLGLISPALSVSGWELLKQYTRPSLVIAGDADEFVPREKLEQYARHATGSQQCRIIAGADHFGWGYEDRVVQEVAQFFARGFMPSQ